MQQEAEQKRRPGLCLQNLRAACVSHTKRLAAAQQLPTGLYCLQAMAARQAARGAGSCAAGCRCCAPGCCG